MSEMNMDWPRDHMRQGLPMRLIWDLPIRLFHWVFAAGFLVAAAIALLGGEDGPYFPYHAIIGLVLLFAICWRVIWGLVGSRYARFDAFPLAPRSLAGYLKDVVTGRGQPHVGLNPASAYVTLAMLALVTGLGVTGVMMGQGNEGVKDVHELLAYAMLAVVGAHLTGIVLHTIRHRENIALSMVHGRRNGPSDAAISSSHAPAALVFLLLTGTWAAALVASLNLQAGSITIPVLGTTLRVGETEHEREEANDAHRGRREDD
jgi:cytochrome b